MPIMNKAQVKRKTQASTSLHYDNETSMTGEESDQAVENNMSVDTLIDPEDYDAAGSTHFDNEDASHPVLAGKKGKKAVKASDPSGCEPGSPLNPGTTNVSTIDNEVDPDQGYIGASDTDDIDPDADDDVDFDVDDPDESDPAEDPNLFTGDDADDGETLASDAMLQNNMSVDKLEADADEGGMTHDGNDMDFDIDASTDDGTQGDDWDTPESGGDESDIDELVDEDLENGSDGVSIEDVQEEPDDVKAADEDLSILDIDETPDDEVSDVAFATAGTRLMVIKANRIIATMTGRRAVASGRNDTYLTDQFQQVTAMELESKGLRKGLKSMGFVLAKVNVAKQSVIEARVKKEVTKTTAAVRRVQGENQKAFEQSLAIASVGINRNMFKGQTNELRAALEGEFRRMGIRGATRILSHVFAEHGPSYAKQVIELAKKISAMPEEVRDSYVEALDMNSGVMDEPDESMVPIGSDAMDDEDVDDDFGDTIEASLARPAHRLQASTAANGKYSVTANEVLNGSRPLFG